MDPELAQYLERHARGRLERLVAVTDLASRATAHVCQTSTGLWLLRRDPGGELADQDLSEAPLAYESGRLRDVLVIGAVRYRVPLGESRDLRRMVAHARLRGAEAATGRAALHRLTSQGHVRDLEGSAKDFVEATLEPDEWLLGWLPTDSRHSWPQATGRTTRTRWHLLVTDRRAALVALSPIGQVEANWLPQGEPRSDSSSRSHSIGDASWRAPRRLEREHAELAELLALPREGRLREHARTVWCREGKSQEGLLDVRSLLQAASRHHDALSHFVPALVDPRLATEQTSLERGLAELRAGGADERVLDRLRRTWAAPRALAEGLVSELEEHGADAEPWALELHRGVRDAYLASDASEIERALGERSWARHLVRTGQREQAARGIELRLAELGEDTHGGAYTVESSPERIDAKIELLSLLLSFSEDAAQRLRAQARLAVLEPLNPEPFRVLASAESEELSDRAKAVLRVLQPGAAPAAGIAFSSARPHALPKALIESALKHPATRASAPMLGQLQALLARVPSPDRRVLRDYCERLELSRHPEVAEALERSIAMLDAPPVDVYVSRGQKAVGVRSYEGPPTFILVGGNHLDPGSPFFMTPRELGFAIGAELAHVVLGHTRATPSEVWTGLMSKTTQGLDLALALLPFLKGLRIASQIRQVFGHVPAAAKRYLEEGRRVASKLVTPPDSQRASEVLSAINEELVAAHRIMQLTADRAGLLIAGDIEAATRSVFLVRRDYATELERVTARGLAGYLHDTSSELQQALRPRFAALLAFYISEDYARLSASLL